MFTVEVGQQMAALLALFPMTLQWRHLKVNMTEATKRGAPLNGMITEVVGEATKVE